ncbi:ATP-binding cassette domain-containing protein [Streptomyces sp. NBC_00249]|uniref:ATP-binding cassette domain-containing protein n=1 Tax=Streptomyces sp. NBC_00249 TaxID=2975690 RepID=UPI00224D9071|nr:ATP-binding cassette domain-containing protein [Streptomyces sp. NBC_00249]MCX5196796.1 ATP-binding cassette domain-containing protein [Streptomyces sp. NBC_00249]
MDSPHGAAVKAEGFGLKGPRGWVFRGVGIDAAPGSLIALEGPSGSGRTCLLLALTGRMKPTEGHAEIGRHRLPKKMAAVRRITALGPVPGVNDLDQALTVAEQLREGAMLQRRYDGPLRALLRPRGEHCATVAARTEAALAAVGLDPATLPKGPRTSVRALERLEALRLSLAIALLGNPRLIALDDLDMKLSDAERAEVWALLRSIADRGTTVLAVCSEAPEGVTVLRTVTAEEPPAPATPAAAPRAESPKVTWGAEADAKADSKADKADTKAKAKRKGKPDPTPEPDPTPASEPEGEAEAAPATESGNEAAPPTAPAAEPADATTTHTTDEDTKGADDALAETGRA